MPLLPHATLPLLALVLMACGEGAAGDRAWKKGDFQGSIAHYQALGELTPQRRFRLARALVGEGDAEGARTLIEAVQQEQWTPDGWMAQGLLLMGEERPAEAAVAFGTGANLGGGPALRVNQCAALLAAETPDPSVCAEALTLAPQDPAALLGLAASSLAADNLVVATRCLEGLRKSSEATSVHLVQAGRIYHALGDAEAACEAFDQGGAALEAGLACAAAGRVAKAEALLDPLVEREPRAAFTLGTLALERALAQTDPGERERAVADAWRRLRVCQAEFGDTPDWLNNAGRLHALDGDEQAAEVAFRRAMALDPSAAYPAMNLARLLEARGDLEESGRLLENVAALGGMTGAIAGLDLARRARDRGDEEGAVERARGVMGSCQASEAAACVVEACIVLATLVAASDPEQAIALLQQAHELGGGAIAARLRAEPDLAPLGYDLRYASIIGGGG